MTNVLFALTQEQMQALDPLWEKARASYEENDRGAIILQPDQYNYVYGDFLPEKYAKEIRKIIKRYNREKERREEEMKLGKRKFTFPIMIHKTNTIYGNKPNISIRWDKSKMAGTMKTTSYTLQIIINGKEFQWSFVWRPSVTRYWWKESKNNA